MLDWLESTSVALWLRESPSVWSFPTVLTLHTTGMAVLVGASWVLNLRLLGINRHVPLSTFSWVFPAVAIGLTVNLVTGVLLFIKNATTLATAVPFLVKMSLVVVSVATLLPIRSLVLRNDTAHNSVSTLPAGLSAGASAEAEAPSAKAGRLLAIASLLAWSGAITAGRLLAYLIV